MVPARTAGGTGTPRTVHEDTAAVTLVTAWIAYFFRDPDRVTPLREGLVIAPADGRIAVRVGSRLFYGMPV